MKYELINPNVDGKDIVTLVFENRGISKEQMFDYIDCDKDYRSNPFDFTNMDKAVEKIKHHIESKSKFGILMDCDCDGAMSATGMYKLLKMLDNECSIKFFIHKEKRHGITDCIMEELSNTDIDILIIPDAGSNQVEELLKVKEMGIDILVVDHHEAEYTDEVLIVNCQYDNINKDLSGGAMVVKLAEAILGEQAKQLNYIAAISIISDNMSMNNLENRYYVKHGLRNIKNKLINKATENKLEISSRDVSYNISPMINAIIRMGDVNEKLIMINALCGIDGKIELPTRKNGKKTEIYDLVDATIKISKWKKDDQKKIVDEEVSKIDFLHNNPINIINLEDSFNRSISGYFANVVSSKNLKPTLALFYDEDDDCYRGSARGANVPEFKNFLMNTNLFNDCEGHQGAFGVDISSENLNKLVESMNSMKLPTETTYLVDKIINSDEVDRDEISAIYSLQSIWGKGIEKPEFVIKLKDVAISFMGAHQNTLRIFKGGITYIKFNCNEEEVRRLKALKGNRDMEILGQFDINVFNGRTNYQVLIKDYNISEETKEYDMFGDEDSDFYDLF